MNETQKQDGEIFPESSAAKLAFYTAFIPLAGFLFYIAFGFLALYQIGRGQTGFHRLSRGLLAVLFLSVAPIVGLVLWAELPLEYYVIVNEYTTHGRIDVTINPKGQPTQSKFFRFGKIFKITRYSYHENGLMRSEANYVGDKLHGTFTYWYDNGNPRLIETFANNRRNGLTSWFDMNGKLERSMNYVDGISQEQIDAAKKAGVPPVIEEPLGGGVKMRMIFIPPGEFMMGSTGEEIAKVCKESVSNWYTNEGPQHKVTIEQGFYLSETEVTQAQWKAIMQENPSHFKDGRNNAPNDTANYPVETISWNDVHRFLKKINTTGKVTFRLPSEAEWEYSARSRTTSSFGYGDDYADLGDYAWYSENSGRITHAVSGKKANNWGFHDMHGNVSEWCADDYHENYQGAPNDGSAWNDNPHGGRLLLRGNSWCVIPRGCRVANRNWYHPVGRDYLNGFRCARSLK